jgi:NAD(P)-dependent dehydrogenase (short-subunit alcohol dehydrogenase family)
MSQFRELNGFGLLTKRSVVITGAGSGVGRAAAGIFAANGAQVVCADILRQSAEDTAAAINAEGGAAVAIGCDVSEESEVIAAIDLAVDRFGRLDIMFNNAGITNWRSGKPRPFHEQTNEDYERLASVNYKGVINGCRNAITRFLRQGDGGVIVNTASVAGMVGWGGAIYGSTKGAVIQLTRSLAIEFADKQIRVNAVCPAGMITNFGGAELGSAPTIDVEAYGRQHPLGRPIAPEDAANAALFLASDLASNITGVILPVDGGYVAA